MTSWQEQSSSRTAMLMLLGREMGVIPMGQVNATQGRWAETILKIKSPIMLPGEDKRNQ